MELTRKIKTWYKNLTSKGFHVPNKDNAEREKICKLTTDYELVEYFVKKLDDKIPKCEISVSHAYITDEYIKIFEEFLSYISSSKAENMFRSLIGEYSRCYIYYEKAFFAALLITAIKNNYDCNALIKAMLITSIPGKIIDEEENFGIAERQFSFGVFDSFKILYDHLKDFSPYYIREKIEDIWEYKFKFLFSNAKREDFETIRKVENMGSSINWTEFLEDFIDEADFNDYYMDVEWSEVLFNLIAIFPELSAKILKKMLMQYVCLKYYEFDEFYNDTVMEVLTRISELSKYQGIDCYFSEYEIECIFENIVDNCSGNVLSLAYEVFSTYSNFDLEKINSIVYKEILSIRAMCVDEHEHLKRITALFSNPFAFEVLSEYYYDLINSYDVYFEECVEENDFKNDVEEYNG